MCELRLDNLNTPGEVGAEGVVALNLGFFTEEAA
jgi:hypothetical protein